MAASVAWVSISSLGEIGGGHRQVRSTQRVLLLADLKLGSIEVGGLRRRLVFGIAIEHALSPKDSWKQRLLQLTAVSIPVLVCKAWIRLLMERKTSLPAAENSCDPGCVDGEFVSAADRYLIDVGVADIADPGGNAIVDHERRRTRISAREHEAALVRSVGQGHKLALNALQFRGNCGPVAVGERAIAALDTETDGSLHRGYDRTQGRISGRELALDRVETLQIAAVEGSLIVVLHQQGSGGRIVGGLVHASAG